MIGTKGSGVQVTKEELREWVDDEGGWFSFLAAGKPVGEDDVPMEIRAAWVDVIWAHSDLQDAIRRLEAKL